MLDAYGVHDELDVDGESSSDDSSVYSRASSKRSVHSKHQVCLPKAGISNAALADQSAPIDDDAQYRRPSWADHRATCESCAKLADVDSSRPSTFRASGGATTQRSAHKATRYNSAATLAAESDSAKRSGIWQGFDELAETVASGTSHGSAETKGLAGPTPQVENQFANSASTQIVKVRSPDSIAVKVRRSDSPLELQRC